MHLCTPTVRTFKRQWRTEFTLLCYSLLWIEPLNICNKLPIVIKVTCHTFFQFIVSLQGSARHAVLHFELKKKVHIKVLIDLFSYFSGKNVSGCSQVNSHHVHLPSTTSFWEAGTVIVTDGSLSGLLHKDFLDLVFQHNLTQSEVSNNTTSFNPHK